MAKKKSSRRWLKEHFDDPFVKKARKEAYRSRAVYKLIEIQEKDKIIQSGMTVVDLGAAPGGWSQCAAQWVGQGGRVFALDRLPIDSIAGVEIIQGDFTDEQVLSSLLAKLDAGVDLVISDLAPNISGIGAIDQPRSMILVELAYDFASQVLKPGGSFLVKVFHGAGFDEFYKTMRQSFEKVVTRKPKASRARSKESYILGKGFLGDH